MIHKLPEMSNSTWLTIVCQGHVCVSACSLTYEKTHWNQEFINENKYTAGEIINHSGVMFSLSGTYILIWLIGMSVKF